MDTRQRRPEERRARIPQGSNEERATGAAEARERASQLLAASDRLIERALSVDSLQFLSQTRQSGGQ